MIARPVHLAQVRSLLRTHPVVALLGARQVGKTTLARELVLRIGRSSTHLDLEDPADRQLLSELSTLARREPVNLAR
jgi:uncharacterized protein